MVKRIFSIFLILLLCFTITLPSFAASQHYSDYPNIPYEYSSYIPLIAYHTLNSLGEISQYNLIIVNNIDDFSLFVDEDGSDSFIYVKIRSSNFSSLNFVFLTSYDGVVWSQVNSRTFTGNGINYGSSEEKYFDYAIVNVINEFDDTVFFSSGSISPPIEGDDESEENVGWFKKIINGIGDIFNAIASLPSKIVSAFSDWFNQIILWIKNIVNAISNLGTTVLNGIKEIFIPDTEELKSTIDSMAEKMKEKLGMQYEGIDELFSNEKPIEDIEKYYEIHGLEGQKYKFFDTFYLTQGVQYFRPYIRAFIILCLVFFNVKMTLSFIKQDAGVKAGKSSKGDDD